MKTTLCAPSLGCLGSASPSLLEWGCGLLAVSFATCFYPTLSPALCPGHIGVKAGPWCLPPKAGPSSPAYRDEPAVGLSWPCDGTVSAHHLLPLEHPMFSRRRRGKRRPAFHFSFRRRPMCWTSAPYIISPEACSWLLAQHDGGYGLRFINVLQAQLLWAPSAPSISRASTAVYLAALINPCKQVSYLLSFTLLR